MSVRALARSSGVHASTLSRWESGATRPSGYELEAVLRALNVSEEESQMVWEQLKAPRALVQVKQSPVPDSSPSMPLQGDLWRAMRMRKGWTLEQTASALGVTAMTLSRWERSEGIPTIEDRTRLGHLLEATQAEIDLLCRTEGGWLPLLHPVPKTLGAIEEILEHRFLLSEPMSIVEDLFYLSLEAFLHRLLRRGQKVQSVLTTAYVMHARALTSQGRLLEAQTPAYSALWWMERSSKLQPRWLDGVHIIAKGAAELGGRFAPHAGIETLTRWLPIASEISPDHEEWFLRDIAEYQSYTRERRTAERLCRELLPRFRKTLLRGDPNPTYTHALVLVNCGSPHEALDLLEGTPHLQWSESQIPLQKLNLSLVWVRALKGVGRDEEAHFWQERVHEYIRQHHIWQVRSLLRLLQFEKKP